MKLRLLIISALMATALFAQGPRARKGNTTDRTYTPPTAAQLAANQLTSIARYLKLDSADTAKLVGAPGLVADIEAEQAALQANATALKTAYSALAAAIAAGSSTGESAAEAAITASLTARVKAAGQVVTAIPGLGLSVKVTAAQLTGVAQMMIGGGGFGGFGGFGGR